jgi:chaperone protein EcpD
MNIIARATCVLAIVTMAVLGVVSPANASVQILGTRVIYPAGEREVTVQLMSNGNSPRLLQVWVDSGDPKETAETTKAPFLITPPMSRIEPGKGQALRLMFTGADLPQDRESVFWLNVLEIPPAPKADASGEAQNFLQFAVRTRIKIFYRPKTLKGDPMGSLDMLTWRLVRDGAKYALECSNPSDYNVSFSDVRLKGAAVPTDRVTGGGMCPAKGRESFAVESEGTTVNGALVYSAINDYGGFVEREATYSH